MTRTMLASKEIERLNTIEEAIEMINVLEYDECLRLLNEMKTLPTVLFDAIVNRAKNIKGKMTLELVLATMQNTLNK